MREVLNAIGGRPLPGVLVVLVACTTSFIWEYLRLSDIKWRTPYLRLVKGVAVTTAILSVVLILTRFVVVERL